MEAGVVRVSVILITRFWSSFDGALRESLSPMTAPTCAGMRRYAKRESDSLLTDSGLLRGSGTAVSLVRQWVSARGLGCCIRSVFLALLCYSDSRKKIMVLDINLAWTMLTQTYLVYFNQTS